MARSRNWYKPPRNQSLQEVFHKLRGEAILFGRGIEKALDEITREIKESGIDLRDSLKDVEQSISKWNLPKRIALRRISKRIWMLATTLKDFYADMEAIFVCAEEPEVLSQNVSFAHELRESPGPLSRPAFSLEDGLAVTYFRVRDCTLSSAQTRFTVLFGMGRRGSRLLWPPDRRRMKK